VIPLLGGTVTGASRHFGHFIALGVNAFVFLCSFGFVLHQSKRRASQPTHWLRYGPSYLVALASLLILADQARHVAQDLKLVHMSMYISDCPIRSYEVPDRACNVSSDCGPHDCGGGFYSQNPGEDCFTCFENSGRCSEEAETFRCLTLIGWTFTVVMTYTGFAIFFFAMFWNANLVSKLAKIKRKWSDLRKQQKQNARKESEAASEA